jgi:hypothetical protein
LYLCYEWFARATFEINGLEQRILVLGQQFPKMKEPGRRWHPGFFASTSIVAGLGKLSAKGKSEGSEKLSAISQPAISR